jgi:hypothetical protein
VRSHHDQVDIMRAAYSTMEPAGVPMIDSAVARNSVMSDGRSRFFNARTSRENFLAQSFHLGHEHLGGVERAIRIFRDVQQLQRAP